MKRRIVPIAVIVIVLVEFVLALYGPMAFVQKPSIVVAKPYSYGLEEADVDRVFDHIQKSLARTTFRVVPHRLIENYYFEKQDEADFSLDERLTYTEYQGIAQELELDQVAVILMGPVSGSATDPEEKPISVTLVIRHSDTGTERHRFKYESASSEDFVAGVRADNTRFNLVEDLRIESKGIGLFDNLFFALLIGQLVLALSMLLGRWPDLLNQILILASLLLALFAFVYAKNASMDYMQRFIAEEGQVSLAESTLTEQLYTAARFLPMLLINLGLYMVAHWKSRTDSHYGARGERWATKVRKWIVAISTDWGLFLAILSALLFSISFPSFLSLRGFPALAWISLIPLFLAIIHAPVGKGIFFGVAYGALQSLILNYWHGTYSYISLSFTVLISAVLFALFFLIFVPIVKSSRRWGFLTATILWVSFEYLRSLFYIGYPWGLIGVSQYLYRPVIQIADLTGIWGVSFLVVLVNGAAAWSFHASYDRLTRLNRWIPTAIATVPLLAALVYGAIRLVPSKAEPDRDMRIVLVQQNTDPRKHDFQLSLTELINLTTVAMAESAPRIPDLVVWPEGGLKTDIRYWLDRPNARGTGPELVLEFLEFQESIGTWLVTGTQDHIYIPDADGEEKKRNFNSSVLLDNRGEVQSFYHKMHLVPFTEHFPYKEELPWLAELLDKFDTSDWLAGSDRVIFDHPTGRFFTPICFEDIFPNDVRKFVLLGADVIVNISNDYWSLTPVEGRQHAIHAMFRAVENRRPMVRSTASGLTTYITTTGKLSETEPDYYTADYLTVDVPIKEETLTVYTRFGDWFAKVCSALVMLLFFVLSVRGVILIVRRQS